MLGTWEGTYVGTQIDQDRAPWCFTMDPSVRWEYCNVRICPTTSNTEPAARPAGSPTATEVPLEQGKTQTLWAIHSFLTSYQYIGYVEQRSFYIWSLCLSDCKVGNGDTYRGPTSITVLGVTCQAWSAQSPHQHNSFTPVTHPTKGLDGNVSVVLI